MGTGSEVTIDVFTLGEAMLRLSTPQGDRLESCQSLEVHVAGAEVNVASTLARLKRKVSWSSRLPQGPLGRRVAAALRAAGVNCDHVVWETEGRIGVYYVDLQADPLPTAVVYDRADSTASRLAIADVPGEVVDQAKVVHLTGITPALSESCSITVRSVIDRASQNGSLITFDVNYRSKLWAPRQAAEAFNELIPFVDLLVVTREDVRDVFAIEAEPRRMALQIADAFEVSKVVVTDGPRGAWWLDGDASGHVKAVPVQIIDRLGAGDAFMAGVLDGLLDGDLESGVRRGVVIAALALTTRGDQAITCRDEINAILASSHRRVQR